MCNEKCFVEIQRKLIYNAIKVESGESMSIKCPKHKKELMISKKTLDFFGEKISLTIGTCPFCNIKYTNYVPNEASEVFTFQDLRYEFLPALAKEYPLMIIYTDLLFAKHVSRLIKKIGLAKSVDVI